MNLSEVNWDFNEAGSWPLEVKVGMILLICSLIAGGGVYQFTMDQLSQWTVLEQKEQELRGQFEEKQKKAANLSAYQEQFKQIEALLEEMVKQMPSEAEVAALLRKISKKAQESGLKINFFGAEPSVRKEFYHELPNKIEVSGHYEEIGLFVSSLSTLSRIVTVHDVIISRLEVKEVKDKKKEDEGVLLEMKAVVQTYNEASEEDADDMSK
ncbi:MAG: type 4a pilus biogenesis protein PilO [Methylococcales bacterium]|nr:type 4a pilus biogenesis protein PilO [Methylococcales bacterium]